ncbi:hypothetical protein AMS68_003681 [Peltaster fructicola]|uniref:Methyltransferase type 11 domain-containing protein n=1 Tax=Peltaster fructicola TaxID=286661 RepID=A0A6H0XTV0_9PEZI|nr:hypothetical protein AMS68_003681 [Peltaster fructicola]
MLMPQYSSIYYINDDLEHIAMATNNLLTGTKGSDWTGLAEKLAERSGNPSTAAIASLLAETNAHLPFSQATGILDNGCGPGSVMTSVLDTHGADLPKDCPLTCSDFSEGMIQQVNNTKDKRVAEGAQHWSRLTTIVSNAMDMATIPSRSCSHILAGWVYFMTPDPQKCLAESHRMLSADGVLGLSSWENSEWLEVMRTLTTVFPDRAIPELPKEWSSTSAVKVEIEKAGFVDVKSNPITVHMGYETHGDLVRFLLKTMPPMVAAMKGLDEADFKKVELAMIERCKVFNSEEPGRLSGNAIVAVGRK